MKPASFDEMLLAWKEFHDTLDIEKQDIFLTVSKPW